MLKKRYANASTNKDILSSDFKYIEENSKEYNGYISLLKINTVSKRCMVPRDNREDDCVLDNGYVSVSYTHLRAHET